MHPSDAAPVATYVVENGRFTFVNRTFADTTGYTTEEILALTSAAELLDESEHAIRIRCRHGSILETQIHRSVVDAGGRRMIVGVAVDINAIAERNEYFRALTENGSDVIAILDAEGCTTYVSPSAEIVLGCTPEEMLGRTHFASVHPDDRERIAEAFRRVTAGGRFEPQTYRFRHRDGRWRVLETTGTNLLAHPHVRGVVLSTRDVTERQRLEEEVAQSRRLTSIGRLAAQVAHEMNNVLMGIQPVVDLARRLASDDAQRLRLADRIGEAIARGKRVTAEILRFARPVQPALQPVDAERLLRKVCEEVRALLPPRVGVDVQIDDAPLYAMADRAQLSQVLINLALNARDAMCGSGTLTLAARRERSFVELRVSDTGSGIAQDDLPYIFEPLFSTKRSGTGLGLTIVFQIVTAHGGHVAVESEPGKGTTFRVCIPAVVEEPSRDDAPRETRLRGRTRVLLVEDDEAIGDGLRWSLQEQGVEVHVVTTAGEVVPALERVRPDVVVLDLSLPDDDGRSAWERITARFDVPVIFSTGHAPEQEIEALLAAPRTALLLKPYSTPELLQAIEKLI
jgi:two-component system, cell cycle sensor histidine kinase and response regulator CckA